MTARVPAGSSVALRVPMPGRPELPLMECLEPRRRHPVGPTRLLLRGALCAYSAPLLFDHLRRRWSDASLELDLSQVTFVDSRALTICDDIRRAKAERGLTFVLVGECEQARRVIGILDLGQLLDAAPDAPASGADVGTADGGFAHVRQVMAHRAVIEQAKGIIMASTGHNADEAFHLLVTQSQIENIKVRDLALELVERAVRPPSGPTTEVEVSA